MGQALDRMIADTGHLATTEEVEEAADVTGQRADTLADALAPVLAFEQSNVEFWLQVAQFAVLLLILREVSR